MKKLANILRCASVTVLAIALNLITPASSPALSPIKVDVVNTPQVDVGNSLKPSQLVTLTSEPAVSCLVDQLQHPDGSTSAFSIPTGKVLVITDAEVFAIGAPPGDAVYMELDRTTGSSSKNIIATRPGVLS